MAQLCEPCPAVASRRGTARQKRAGGRWTAIGVTAMGLFGLLPACDVGAASSRASGANRTQGDEGHRRPGIGNYSALNEMAMSEVRPVVMLPVTFVELTYDQGHPRYITKLFVPLRTEVARWWHNMDRTQLRFGLRNSSVEGELPQLLVEVRAADRPLFMDGHAAAGFVAEVDLPNIPNVAECKMGTVLANVVAGPLADVGEVRALVVICPAPRRDTPLATLEKRMLPPKFFESGPLRWLLIPWGFLLLPLIIGSTIGPMALLGGACLTVLAITCVSFLIAVALVAAHKRCLRHTRRWRRLSQLWMLTRRPAPWDGEAFSGPCCICLGDEQSQPLIALLPCRHALHADCYWSWVKADSYPCNHLICPLCRRRVSTIGRLERSATPELPEPDP